MADIMAAVKDKPVYVIHASDGEKRDYTTMPEELQNYDAIFFGELHSHPIASWLQGELTA